MNATVAGRLKRNWSRARRGGQGVGNAELTVRESM